MEIISWDSVHVECIAWVEPLIGRDLGRCILLGIMVFMVFVVNALLNTRWCRWMAVGILGVAVIAATLEFPALGTSKFTSPGSR